MFDAMFFCTAKHTNVIHYKDIWMKKFEHKIDENNTTKHGIDIIYYDSKCLHVMHFKCYD